MSIVPDGQRVAQILITRTLTEDDDIISTQASGGLTALEALGMLEMAKEDWSAFRPDDEDD